MFEIDEMVEQMLTADRVIRVAYEEINHTIFKDSDICNNVNVNMLGCFKIDKITINDRFNDLDENEKLECIKEAVNNVIIKIQKERTKVVMEEVFKKTSES